MAVWRPLHFDQAKAPRTEHGLAFVERVVVDGLRHNHRGAEVLVEALQPRSDIHRVAQRGVAHALDTSDVAHDGSAAMDADADGGGSCRTPRTPLAPSQWPSSRAGPRNMHCTPESQSRAAHPRSPSPCRQCTCRSCSRAPSESA